MKPLAYRRKNLMILLLGFFLFINFQLCIAQETVSAINDTNQRIVLLELFVQANCSTCPNVEFCLEDIFWEYGPQKVLLLEEHLWNDGYDIQATNERYEWYVPGKDKGTPDLFINGLNHRVQGLVCTDMGENYEYYKNLIDSEAVKTPNIQISAEKKVIDSTIKIAGQIENISKSSLKDLVIGGMVYREGEDPGLSNWVKEIFSFQDLPKLSYSDSIDFEFISGLKFSDEEKSFYHTVLFIQNTISKEVLQALFLE